MGRGFDKFKLLIWKNWVLQKRHKMQTLTEILAPVIFATLMVLVRSLVKPEMQNIKYFEPFNASEIIIPPLFGSNSTNSSIGNMNTTFFIAYSPDPPSNMARNLIKNSFKYLLIEKYGTLMGSIYAVLMEKYIKGFKNSTEMLKNMTNPFSDTSYFCGIQLDDSLNEMETWPDNVNLTLRFPAELRTEGIQAHFFNWYTNFLFPIFQVPGPRNAKSKYGGFPGYQLEGFAPISHAVLRQITIEKCTEAKLNLNCEDYFPTIELERFPHPSFLKDDMLTALRNMISIIIMLSFNYTCINTVKVVAAEKEKQLKEVMKIMGLDNWLHWTAWFIKSFSYILITSILLVILFKVEWYTTTDGISGYSVFTYTPWHFIFVFLLVFLASSICFCFLISVFFSKANTAATVAGMLWFLSYAPFMFLFNSSTVKSVLPSFTTRIFACLASNTAMAYGFQIILDNEATAEGLQWSKIWTPLSADDPMVMGHVILMLVLDAVLYLLITLYVEQVLPGSFGVPQPWYFPVSTEFWRSICRSKTAVEDIPQESSPEHTEGHEPDPRGLPIGINVINLTKVYKKKVAVDNLNYKIFEGQITVLLGHNGAGKTTTMSMLTGMIPPTHGTAIVAGYDIRHNIVGVRESLGICPQHNVLFSDLTVAEHLYFYAKLKGITEPKLTQEIDRYVSLLGLEDKRDVLSNALSGGMQRRLSVGAALCGGSKVVLLDEPSSGMDPAARRHLWDLLHAEKKGRTIILSTHFMDEAEVLGERVGVMAGGKLKAVGSPFYLKKKFGNGYKLTAATTGRPSAPITALIRRHINEATLYSEIGSELSYLLPDELSGKFEPMLKELETKHNELGLTSFGISATTLEDVFMKVGADAVEVVDDQDQIVYKESDTNGVLLEDGVKKNGHISENGDMESLSNLRYTGFRLYKDQWVAMLYKKMIVQVRSWILALLQLFIPVLFLIIAILVDRVYQKTGDLPARNLTLFNGYQDSVTLVNYESPIDDVISDRVKMYKKFFLDSNITSMKVVDIEDKSLENYYLDEAKTNMPQMRFKNLAGATFNNTGVKVWFSNFAFHDLPASMILVYNGIVKTFSPTSSFSLINYPLPYSVKNQFDRLSTLDNSGFQIAFNIGFSMAVVSAFFVLFYVKENVCRSKLLQLASGASPLILWGSAFLWDLFFFIFMALALCITLAIAQQEGFSSGPELARMFFVLMVFGWGMLPLHFIAAHFFHTPSTGFSRMCLINIFTGVATFLVVEVLNTPGLDLENVGNILHWIFLLIPNYALCGAIKNLYYTAFTLRGCLALCDFFSIPNCNHQTICHLNQSTALERCCLSDDPYFEWQTPGVAAHVVYMMLVGLICFLALLFSEYGFINKFLNLLNCFAGKSSTPLSEEPDDSDVSAERELVASFPKEEYNNYNLLIKEMSKYYKNFLAVNKLSVGVKNGECFGLLGINGAGKTTTFKMLTGDLSISSGGAWVVGCSVNTDMKNVYKNIGYCPQFDALLDEMTGRETLHMYARLRGIPPLQQQKYVWGLSRKLGYVKHLDKLAGEYSGGNKRKLSTSLALLGDPQVVYLDEPTTGMDPLAKRQVWRAVSGRATGSVVLTSHSMEECEALCTRLAIMVNGHFRCLGSTQHLKSKFSQGYTLIVKLKRLPVTVSPLIATDAQPDLLPSAPSSLTSSLPSHVSSTMFNFDALHQFLIGRFPGAELKESYQGLVTYYLPDTTIMWSRIFGVMEAAKSSLDIEDYSIMQTSLEQIFLQFTKDQRQQQDD